MKEIAHARSKKNGIVFYSNTMPELAVDAFVDENGVIHTEVVSLILADMLSCFRTLDSDDFEVEHILSKDQLVTLDTFLILISVVAFRSVAITFALIYFSLLCSKNLLDFIEVALSFKLGTMKNTAKFHSAEHMALNAYHKLQRIPTLEEIKHFSCFSQSCGSMIMFRYTIPHFLVSICLACINTLNPIMYVLLVIACYLFVLFLDKVGLLKFLQIFLTSKPTDLELKVAIKGLEEFEKMERNIQKEVHDNVTYFFFQM